jgi:hypothetical protein
LDKAAEGADDRHARPFQESEPPMLVALLFIAVAIAALLAYAGARPDSFRYERAIHIDAPILQVAEQIDDFR